MTKKRYIFAYDQKIKKKVVHTLSADSTATSMVSGSKFKYKPKKKGK